MNKRYRFNGKERDEETGLYYYGARYYAAWIARWTSADPLGIGADGPGVYNYTRGSPVTLTDPNGTSSEEVPDTPRVDTRKPVAGAAPPPPPAPKAAASAPKPGSKAALLPDSDRPTLPKDVERDLDIVPFDQNEGSPIRGFLLDNLPDWLSDSNLKSAQNLALGIAAVAGVIALGAGGRLAGALGRAGAAAGRIGAAAGRAASSTRAFGARVLPFLGALITTNSPKIGNFLNELAQGVPQPEFAGAPGAGRLLAEEAEQVGSKGGRGLLEVGKKMVQSLTRGSGAPRSVKIGASQRTTILESAKRLRGEESMQSEALRKLQRRAGDKEKTGLLDDVPLTEDGAQQLVESILDNATSSRFGRIKLNDARYKGEKGIVFFDDAGRGVLIRASDGQFITFIEGERGLQGIFH